MEKDIEIMMRKNVERQGGKFLKFISPGNGGVPDRIAIFPGGEIWFVELKTEHGQIRPLQRKWKNLLEKLGCNSVIIRGNDEARAWLDDHRRLANGIRST